MLLKSSARYCMCEEQTDIKDVKLYFLTAKLVVNPFYFYTLHVELGDMDKTLSQNCFHII